jgi:ABC transporter substrate binding protein
MVLVSSADYTEIVLPNVIHLTYGRAHLWYIFKPAWRSLRAHAIKSSNPRPGVGLWPKRKTVRQRRIRRAIHFAPEGWGRDPWHGRKIRCQPRHRHGVDGGAHRYQPGPLRPRTAALAVLRFGRRKWAVRFRLELVAAIDRAQDRQGLSPISRCRRVPQSPQSKFFVPAIESAASSPGVQALAVPVRATGDTEPALESFARQPNGGLIFIRLREKLIADLALRHRLPVISTDNEDSAKPGVLMYYGVNDVNVANQFRQAATYINLILRGAKPGDLPVQGPDKYTLIINLKAAKALGLTISREMMLIADQLLE